MALTTTQIQTYLLLRKVGPKAVLSLYNYAIDNDISFGTTDEMLDFINYCIENKIVARIKDPFSPPDIDYAYSSVMRNHEKAEDMGIKTISIADDIFPLALRHIVDEKGKDNSPLVLHIKGDLNTLVMPKAIAIIGTREPTQAGVKAGLYFSRKFAEAGFNIVSGLAVGCDTTAHKGALEANGITTAFIASGLDMPIYPKENEALAEEIVLNGGALISEYDLGEPVMPNRFVERDRLQSGLAKATLAIQTGIKGGTLHASNATIYNNKPLYMVQYKDKELEEEKVQGNVKYINEKKALPLTSENIDEIIEYLSQEKKLSIPTQGSLFDNF